MANLSEEMIKRLEDKGFNRWTKGTMDRLYINAGTLGLEVRRYKTGNISHAEFNGVEISHAEGYRMLSSKTYIDIKTGKVFSDNDTLEQAAKELLDGVLSA